MSVDENKALYRRGIEAINAQDLDAVDRTERRNDDHRDLSHGSYAMGIEIGHAERRATDPSHVIVHHSLIDGYAAKVLYLLELTSDPRIS